MTPDDLAKWASVIKDGILAIAVLFLVVGGVRGIYRWGWEVREAIAQRDRELADVRAQRDGWKDVALRALPVAQAALYATPPSGAPPP